MKSIIRENIIANEKLTHNCLIEAKRIHQIVEGMEITTRQISDMFYLSPYARQKVNKKRGMVTIKLYNEYELQDIGQKIQQDIQNIEFIDLELTQKLKGKFKISDKEISIYLNISYNQLVKLKTKEKYRIKNQIYELKNEFIDLYRYKIYLVPEDVIDLKEHFTMKQIAKIFNIKVDTIRELGRRKNKKVRIHTYTLEDHKKIIEGSSRIIQKQRTTLNELEEIIKNQKYDKEIILESLGISNLQYYALRKGLINTISVSDIIIKRKVDMYLLDLEKLYGYGLKEYKLEELEENLKEYDLNIDEFIEYSDKNKLIREMYKESIINNKKIELNKKTKDSTNFIKKNFDEIQSKIKAMVINFCIVNRCFSYIEDYIQDINLHLFETGGFITKNMMHHREKCINMLCMKAKAELKNKYYNTPKELSIDISYYGSEISADCNRNFIDTKYEPESILEKREEITNLHQVIIENIKQQGNIKLENRKCFFEKLADKLNINSPKMKELIEQIQLIILQNKLVKQDKLGRIIICEEID